MYWSAFTNIKYANIFKMYSTGNAFALVKYI